VSTAFSQEQEVGVKWKVQRRRLQVDGRTLPTTEAPFSSDQTRRMCLTFGRPVDI